ncbi:uncharacterized protein LOC128222934 isoform X2 [Mya arenaria]|uniref:uncharacterized protein LOC128222934 isoform X2 n=1 Tax=Mya arenaria TaxID=6604 RepID=UPI0022E072D2|nr:uncharacterized protein LOC128222934 isoform X2 [Mya arenaria]
MSRLLLCVVCSGFLVVTICEGSLSVDNRGLDIIFAVDTSSSIGSESLDFAKRFMSILVQKYGVSADREGGKNGTRFAILTFASTANLHLQIDDKNVRTVDSTIAKINEITTTGGGTSFSRVLNTIIIRIHLSKIAGSKRSGHRTNKALFLLTVGEQTVKELNSLNQKLNILKDYGKCGISGSTEITEGTDNSKKGAWPWVGWLSAHSKTCGGVLLCARYFMTSARCVSDVSETGQVIPYTRNGITVNLGDSRLYQGDDEQVMPIVKGVNIHPNYTGVPNEHDIRDYDVAILDFGEDDRTQPPLNKFIKPICFPFRKLYRYSLERLKFSKVLDGEAHGFTVGWGLSPSFTRQLPWVKQKQNRREIQSDFICGRQYPDLDTDRYFCVGNIRKEGDSCRGDIGGAYMAELRAKRYSAFGIAQRTYDCQEHRHFSIFLDLHHPSITEWALPILGRCNRLGSAEDEEKEAEKERAQKKTEETNLLKKAG